MFSHSSAALSSNLRDLDRRLRSLESHLQRIGNRTSANAALAADATASPIPSALSSLAERFRGNATYVGNEAARAGTNAVRRLSAEVENRPLVMLGVAAAVGLLIGFSLQRHS